MGCARATVADGCVTTGSAMSDTGMSSRACATVTDPGVPATANVPAS